MRQGLADYRATGSELARTFFLAELAELYGQAGHAEEGLTVLAEAQTQVRTTEEHWHDAELYRLTGELTLQQLPDGVGEAEACFHQALDVSRQQEAKSLELRAATSLARLWQSQGKLQEAYDLLAPVYKWFTEGFDTADLKDAKSLLNELA